VQAQAKLAALYVGVGYPEQWTSSDGLTVSATDALGNLLRAEKFHTAHEIAKLDQPVDHHEWQMPANAALALNSGMQNQLNFSAAYLQPPYFDPQASDATNYGSVGAIIGHEITHMFDDTGSRFDADGRLRNWWTAEDQTRFKAAMATLVTQYSSYTPLPGLRIDGQRTLTENSADLIGLSVAFNAYRASLIDKSQGKEDDRQFFIGFAEARRVKLSEAALKKQIASDTHAPPKYRILTVRNLDAWYQAFDVQPGQALYLQPGDRIGAW
jgi:endothelin-converting enzyme/putative endopeptidase